MGVEILVLQPCCCNKKDTKAFSGVVNFVKTDIWYCAQIIAPTTQLLTKGVKLHWEDEKQEAFVLIKAKVVEAMMLVYPHHDVPFNFYLNLS
eukprot:2838985-Ditylum_brightwellii.AAC.1